MDWDRYEGQLKQLGGKITERWGKLTNNSQRESDGLRTQRLGRMQARYGYAKDQAAQQLKAFLRRNRNWAN